MKERDKKLYACIDVHMCENQKIARAGRQTELVGWLHIAGITYAKRNNTDGFIPDAVAQMLTPSAKRLLKIITETCDLWEKVPEGFRVHHYGEWQETSVEIERKRAVRAAAGASGGVKSGLARAPKPTKQTRSKKEANASILLKQNAKQNEADEDEYVYEDKTPPSSPPSGGRPASEVSSQASKEPSAAVAPKRFVPPTAEEAEAVFAERGFGGLNLGAKFVAHYAAAGWKRSGNVRMVDWHHAITTWVLKRQEQNGNGPPAFGESGPRGSPMPPTELRDAPRPDDPGLPWN